MKMFTSSIRVTKKIRFMGMRNYCGSVQWKKSNVIPCKQICNSVFLHGCYVMQNEKHRYAIRSHGGLPRAGRRTGLWFCQGRGEPRSPPQLHPSSVTQVQLLLQCCKNHSFYRTVCDTKISNTTQLKKKINCLSVWTQHIPRRATIEFTRNKTWMVRSWWA